MNRLKKQILNLLYDYVYNYPTVNKQGFTPTELNELIDNIKTLFTWNQDKYDDAMMGNTCMLIDDKIISYHCDVYTGVRCAVENDKIKLSEFD